MNLLKVIASTLHGVYPIISSIFRSIITQLNAAFKLINQTAMRYIQSAHENVTLALKGQLITEGSFRNPILSYPILSNQIHYIQHILID